MTDSEILDLFAKEETKERAFMSLMQTYKERLYWHVFRMVNNHTDADDLLQDVFMKIWQKLHLFKGNASLYTFLYRIATNTVIDFLKKKNKKVDLNFESEEEEVINEPVADVELSADEVLAKLDGALASLPEKQRLVFNMRYYDEMTYDQISEVLGTSKGGLKASYHLAVKKIENYILSH